MDITLDYQVGCVETVFMTRLLITDARESINALEREVKELRRANEILKVASDFFVQAELDRRFKS